MLRSLLAIGGVVFASLGVAGLQGVANAAYIDPATNLIKASGSSDVFVRFEGSFAGFSTDVVAPDYDTAPIFNSKTTAPGTIVNLGSFSADSAINFQINVLTTGYSFVTGLASDNLDGVVHAFLSKGADGQILIGFEDVFGGGDQDFDDVLLSLYETPLPAGFLLFLSGVAGMGLVSRAGLFRRKA